jgi:inactive STAND/Trypsin-like peptidase domain
MTQNIQDSVVLVSSQDSAINQFGTGFVICQIRGITYVLTCAHVVEDVGGSKKVQVDGMEGTVVASGKEIGLDLAVLKVDGLRQRSPFVCCVGAETGKAFRAIGFQAYGKDLDKKDQNILKPLSGNLGEFCGLQSRQGVERIDAWGLRIAEDYSLQPGYSGSPVIDEITGKVVAVVSHREGDKSGLAISIEELKKIWILPNSKQLHGMLLKLGYKEQMNVFNQLTKQNKSLIAFTIHGEEFYGQCWLLNRLVSKYIPDTTLAKVAKIKIGINVRPNDIQALWRALGEWFGIEERQPTPSQVIEKIYLSWQTQHVLLFLHEIDRMPLTVFDQLIQEFWIPLTQKLQAATLQGSRSKLLMFLVDYKGVIGEWEFPFTDHIDNTWEVHNPVRAPKLLEFSSDDLSGWLGDNQDRLPAELTKDIDQTVEMILEKSDDGVPEIAFDEICVRCGCDWEEESKKWLRY